MYINWFAFWSNFLRLFLLKIFFIIGFLFSIESEVNIHWLLAWNSFCDHFCWNYRIISWDYLRCCYHFHSAMKRLTYPPSEVYFYLKSHLKNLKAILSVLKLNYPHFKVIFGFSFLSECINCRYKPQIHGRTDKD